MKMIENPKLDVEKFLAKLDARMFGIPLHWLPHVNGALAVSNILKKLHPETPIVFDSGFGRSEIEIPPFERERRWRRAGIQIDPGCPHALPATSRTPRGRQGRCRGCAHPAG